MQQSADLKSLDDLIANLGGAGIGTRSAGPCGMLLEHIQAARRGLLGSMHAEYSSSLQFAQESLACIPDKAARGETRRMLQSLIDSEARPDARALRV